MDKFTINVHFYSNEEPQTITLADGVLGFSKLSEFASIQPYYVVNDLLEMFRDVTDIKFISTYPSFHDDWDMDCCFNLLLIRDDEIKHLITITMETYFQREATDIEISHFNENEWDIPLLYESLPDCIDTWIFDLNSSNSFKLDVKNATRKVFKKANKTGYDSTPF